MAQENLLRTTWRKTAIAPTDLDRIAERLLLQWSIFLVVALGLVFMTGRFIVLLKEDLKGPPDDLASAAMLAIMVAAVAVMVTLACTAAGAILGLALKACFGKRLRRIVPDLK